MHNCKQNAILCLEKAVIFKTNYSTSQYWQNPSMHFAIWSTTSGQSTTVLQGSPISTLSTKKNRNIIKRGKLLYTQ